jgi:hypothetical protein
MKRPLRNTPFVIALAFTLAIAGCSGSSDPPANPPADSPANPNPTPPVAPPSGTPNPAPPPTPSPPSPQTVPLDISLEGSGIAEDGARGISCAASCTAQLTPGTTVNLTARPDSGSTFVQWGGACSGNGACALTIQAATSVTARFVPTVAGTSSGGDLFATVASPGAVTVTLHPGTQVTTGQTTKVAFGVPFPRGLVASTDALRVTDGSGNEVASAVSELTRWRTIAAGGAESVRAALFYVDVLFQDRTPQTLRVEFGNTRTRTLAGAQPAVTSLWTSIANGPVPGEYPAADDVREPIVYVTLPADWLGRALLVTRTGPVNPAGELDWWDAGLVNFAKTAVNDVAATVLAQNHINLIAEEPWLYDRALTLFNVYLRTGDVQWLRRAHRAAQWYAKKVGSNGIFTLSSYNADLKYSYGLSLLIDHILTGDGSLRAPIERVAQAGVREWQTTYSASLGFWTERHHAYAILAALSAFEATGDRTHAQRATQLVNLTMQMSQNAAKCPLHTVEQHEGVAADTRLMCSPWMLALLAEAVLRYYILSEDPAVLAWLAGMEDFVRQYALYDGGIESTDLAGKTMPWYLVGPTGRIEDGRGWGDMEHACDVAGLVAKSAWAKKRLGQSSATAEGTARDLLATCEFVLGYWHRSTPTLAEYRLSPPRKFSWWFGSTSDLGWMLGL